MHKVDIYADGAIRVRFPARTWERAHAVIQDLRDAPPDGYKLTDSRVAPRGRWKGGRRCNVRLTFTYCDSRHPKFTEEEAMDFFKEDAERARLP